MHLPISSCQRFYHLLDALSLYAKDKLNLPSFPGDNYSINLPMLGDEFRNQVDKVLWNCPDIIEDFVNENPYGLDTADLAVILTWKHSRRRIYTLWKHEGGRSVLMGGDGTFYVIGLSRDISNIIPNTPTFIETTLLPFDGAITYGTLMMQYPIEMLGGMLKMQRELYEEAQAKGITSSAQEFIKLQKAYNEQKDEEELEEFWSEISRQNDVENGREVLPEGIHRGVLAGLSEEERERKVTERVSELSSPNNVMLDVLFELATRKEPSYTLHDHLMLETKDDLIRMAKDYGLKGLTGYRKDKVAEVLASQVLEHIDLIKNGLIYCNEGLFEAICLIFKAGGTSSISAESPINKGGLFLPYPPYTRLFLHENTFTLAMPAEIRDLLRTLDWNEIHRLRKQTKEISHCATVCADIYGLMRIEDFSSQLKKWYGHEFSIPDLLVEIIRSTRHEERNYTIWLPDNGFYLASAELVDELSSFDKEEDEALAEYREHILMRHEEIPRKPLDPALKDMDPFEWKMKLPASIRLRNYLDAHVLDGIDDCLFAEDILEDLLLFSSGGTDPSSAAEYLGYRGLLFDELFSNTLLTLVAGMLNGIPVWENNGWSPQELIERETGERSFFNENGTKKKVGRNDPCPCGSGKKYKKCCGK